MYLAEVEESVTEARAEERPVLPPLPSDRWEHFPHSAFSHHGKACCDVAREWVSSMDYAMLNGGDLASGPRWIRARYKWGASQWPMHWCEVVERKVIDCGAHAALAQEAFTARGVAAYRAQFVQKYSADATSQWRKKWGDEQVSDHWLTDDDIYHEGNALLVGEDEVKLWDASAGWWIDPRQSGGYGSLLSVRVFARERESFRWGGRHIAANTWEQVGPAG